MSVAEKLVVIAENEQRVYEAGKAMGIGGFWDAFQAGGKRANYELASQGWSAETIRPKYKVIPTNVRSGLSTFYGNEKLTIVEKEYFDFSSINPSATNDQQAWRYTFIACSNLQIVEDIGMKAGRYYSTWQSCLALHTIEKMRIAKDCQINQGVFQDCRELTNLTIEGEIGQNGFDIHWSTKLSRNSIISILDALSTETMDLTVTLSLAAVNKAFETSVGANDGSTSTEWLNAEAYHDNWTISLV